MFEPVSVDAARPEMALAAGGGRPANDRPRRLRVNARNRLMDAICGSAGSNNNWSVVTR